MEEPKGGSYLIAPVTLRIEFALERATGDYDFRAYLQAIGSTFQAEGYQVELKVSKQNTVHSAFVCFRGLLHALGLSPHRTEVLAVKMGRVLSGGPTA